MNKLKHYNCCLKQGNRPICGIYAFLNGALKEKDYDCDDICAVIDDLWSLAVDNDLENLAVDSNSKYKVFDVNAVSVVGEFFSSEKLIEFLTFNNKRILYDLKKCNSRIQEYNIEPIKLIDIDTKSYFQNNRSNEKADNFKDINSEKIVSYLVPINTSWNCENVNNLHWVCVKKYNDSYYLYNSADNYTAERKAMYNWCRYKKKIRENYELKNLWRELNNRNKNQYFNFTKWVNKQKIKEQKYKYHFPKNYIVNLRKIKKSERIYKSSFKKSKFDILKVIVTYKT